LKLIPLLALLLLASQPATMLITIDSNGVVEAHLSLKTIEGLNEVRLPVEPIPETIEVRVGSEYVAAIYENGILYFFSPMPGDAEITYMVNISARNNILSFDIGGENLTRLRIPPQVILLMVPRNITGMEYVEGDLVIEFYGPERIEYAVRAGATTQPTITTTRAETMTPTMKTAISTVETTKMVITITQTGTTSIHAAESAGKLGISLTDPAIIVGLIVIVIVMVAAILAYSKSRGRGMPGEDHTLTKLDRMILESIENAGGSILQGELQATLGLPKTTLWRHVKKLGKLGYIQIVKEGTLNRLILLKKPSRGFSPSS
jgi:uncharacterized membrane protein